MTDRQKWIAGVVLLVSLLLNVFFIQNYFTKKPAIVTNTGTVIQNPNTVIAVKPIITVKPNTGVRPQVVVPPGRTSTDILLASLEAATPIITTDPFTIVQNKNKQFVFPKSINGTLELGYLNYKFDMKLNAKVIYSDLSLIPIELGLLAYQKNNEMAFTPEVMFPFFIPFTQAKVYLGAGPDMASISGGFQLLDNSFLQIGAGYKYTGEVVPFVGMSLGL